MFLLLFLLLHALRPGMLCHTQCSRLWHVVYTRVIQHVLIVVR